MSQNDDPNLPPRQKPSGANRAISFLMIAILLIALVSGVVTYMGYSEDTPLPVAAATRAPQQAYAGIGLQLAPGPQGPVVVRTWPGTPSVISGLQKGDLIISVDGTYAAGISLADVTNRIKGAAGTTVTLVYSRNGGPQQKVSITREIIPPSVFEGK